MSSARKMSQSPVAVAKEAYEAAKQVLPPYSDPKSRHDYTQAQLFAILVLRQFFQMDYRGIEALLRDFSDLRHALDLPRVPHYTTLQKAQERFKKKGICLSC